MFWQASQALRDEVAGERRRADEARGELKKLFFFQRELHKRHKTKKMEFWDNMTRNDSATGRPKEPPERSDDSTPMI